MKEIVRQMRLRDLGGIIMIDFIDMEERRNREKVMAALEDALRADRAPSKMLRFNEFGLIAITRKRTKQALERTLCQPCPYCTGSGMVKSIPTLCYEIQTEARKMAPEMDRGSLTLRVHPEISKALKTRESSLIEELEQLDEKERHHPGRPHAALGAVRHLLAIWSPEATEIRKRPEEFFGAFFFAGRLPLWRLLRDIAGVESRFCIYFVIPNPA